jgi:DNA-binding Lrp family transcriptional regulator
MELIHRFDKRLKTAFVFPVITKREYPRNYLIKKTDEKYRVLFGDRDKKELSKNEKKVLKQLVENPDKKIITISEKLKMPIKTLVRIKKNLEKQNIIKGYSCVLNNADLEINRQILFLRFSSERIKEIDKFEDFCRNNKNIIEYVKVIGASQAGVVVESLKEIDIIKKIRTSFLIESYLPIKSEKIHKKEYLSKINDFG